MQMDQVTQANSAQTEEMSSTAQGLSANSEQLKAAVGRFKLGSGSASSSSASSEGRSPAANGRAGARRPSQNSPQNSPHNHGRVTTVRQRPDSSLAALERETRQEEAQFEEF
jgi:hypothetical protein